MSTKEEIEEARQQALDTIRIWRRIEPFPNGTWATCFECHSTDIRVHPDCSTEWACAECGFSCTSPFLGFGQILTCTSCGKLIKDAPSPPYQERPKITECPGCHKPFDPPI